MRFLGGGGAKNATRPPSGARFRPLPTPGAGVFGGNIDATRSASTHIRRSASQKGSPRHRMAPATWPVPWVRMGGAKTPHAREGPWLPAGATFAGQGRIVPPRRQTPALGRPGTSVSATAEIKRRPTHAPAVFFGGGPYGGFREAGWQERGGWVSAPGLHNAPPGPGSHGQPGKCRPCAGGAVPRNGRLCSTPVWDFLEPIPYP